MSAERLREAARAERDEWGGEQNAKNYPKSAAIHLALADLLEEAASKWERDYDAYHPGKGWWSDRDTEDAARARMHFQAASEEYADQQASAFLAVADAILGTQR